MEQKQDNTKEEISATRKPHIVMKTKGNNNKILEAAKKQKRTYYTVSTIIRMKADISSETGDQNTHKKIIFKSLKEKERKNGQPRILLTTKLSFKNKGKIQNFPINKN